MRLLFSFAGFLESTRPTAPFLNVFVTQIPPEDKQKTAMKVIVTGESEKVVGIHIIGMGADEMMQGFGVAMKVHMSF